MAEHQDTLPRKAHSNAPRGRESDSLRLGRRDERAGTRSRPFRWALAGAAGMLGGLAGNGTLGILFSLDVVRSVLYDPAIQSELFIEITPQRNIPLSVAGLVVLSAIHGWLYAQLAPAMPGTRWPHKGAYWGAVIFSVYWLPQEWFVYHTLLGEPLVLNLLELTLLLAGSLAEGLVIAACLRCRGAGGV